MKRALVLLVAATALLAGASLAEAAPTAKQKTTAGFFRGQAVRYFDFGPVKLAPGSKLAPIWVVTNGTAGQRNIVDVVPGQKGYSPLWKVVMVTWKDGVAPRLLTSAGAVRKALRAGDVSLKKTDIVVNCPVLGFGQKKVAGFHDGKDVKYLDLGQVKLAPGNETAPIWGFTNGAAGQRNMIDVIPGDDGYSPLWTVEMVTWADGATPRVLRSRAEVEAAAAAGEVTIAKTAIVVNCPVV